MKNGSLVHAHGKWEPWFMSLTWGVNTLVLKLEVVKIQNKRVQHFSK